jgi:tRNA threonylcarbamoyladenosine biosynthesis protein TsaE
MRLHLQGEAAQQGFGERLARAFDADWADGWLVYLHGDLGTGKTTLVRGILRGLGHHGPVKSPTYTLIEPYEPKGRRVFHLDLYRLGGPEELEYLGLRDLLDVAGLILVEWPERGRAALPPPDLEIDIHHAGEARDLEVLGSGPRAMTLIRSLAGV